MSANYHCLLRVGFVLFCWINAVVGSHAAEPYDWPLKKDRVITSSFGEYRPRRFHAGIDLRAPAIGEPVYAPADGFVNRVRCSPWGYGKALYLTLHDGNMVVFGHLSDFAPPIREYVRQEQHARKSYTVDLNPERQRFPVKRGELVAFTGDTGAGPAHLHYELRDSANRALNPLLLGISWPDNSPPCVHAVLVAPRGPDSYVEGDIVPKVLPVQRTDSGGYTIPPVNAYGEVGIAADTDDPANAGANILGIYRTRLVSSGEEQYRVQLDRIPYDTIHHGSVTWHPYALDQGKFLLQWLWDGNRSDYVRHTPGKGWITVTDKPVDVRLEIEDANGNATFVEIPFVPSKNPPEFASTTSQEQRPSKTGVDYACYGDYIVVTATFPKEEHEPPTLGISGGNPEDITTAFRQVAPNVYRAGYRPGKNTQRVTLWADHDRIQNQPLELVVFHRDQTPREEHIGKLTIRAATTSPFGVLFVGVRETEADRTNAPLPVLSKMYHLWPQAAPIDEAVTIRFPIPQGGKRLDRVDIYRRTGSGWTRESTRRNQDSLEISATQFGTFAAMEDSVAPAFRNVVPAEGATLAGLRPEISAKVTDVGSGVANVSVTANGTWLLAEYDGESGKVQWVQDEDLPRGDVTLEFVAKDAAGNTTTVTRRIRVGVAPKS